MKTYQLTTAVIYNTTGQLNASISRLDIEAPDKETAIKDAFYRIATNNVFEPGTTNRLQILEKAVKYETSWYRINFNGSIYTAIDFLTRKSK